MLLLPLTIYVLRLDDVAGMMVDDGWYVMLAKALAEGHGYRLINAPVGEYILPLYPPGFPVLLSLSSGPARSFPTTSGYSKYRVDCRDAWRRRADPPLSASLSTTAASARGHGGVAVAITPSFVFLATSTVMSECVFAFAQLGAVVLAHRAAAAPSGRELRPLIVAALVAAATVLIRSAGVAVVAAVFFYLLHTRLWKRAAIFTAIVAMCLLPWLIYARVHAPSAQQKQIHRGAILYSYGEQFWMRWAGSVSTGRVTVADLKDRVGTNAVDVFGRGMGGIFAPMLLRGPDESGQELLSIGGQVGWTFVGMGNLSATMAVSFALAAVVCLGSSERRVR